MYDEDLFDLSPYITAGYYVAISGVEYLGLNNLGFTFLSVNTVFIIIIISSSYPLFLKIYLIFFYRSILSTLYTITQAYFISKRGYLIKQFSLRVIFRLEGIHKY